MTRCRSQRAIARGAEAEWVKITGSKTVGADFHQQSVRWPKGRPAALGIWQNAAVSELGIERTEARRSVKIANLSKEAEAWRPHGSMRHSSE
jgi:hypothetical protein